MDYCRWCFEHFFFVQRCGGGFNCCSGALPVATDNCDADVTNIVKIAGAFVPELVKEQGHILIHGR
ncbi:MAG: hypothetical protein IPN68_10795 [Bacteroidetes bacterium]|nr:hypothetical protein [Bacteroidota bacterium]